MSKSPIQRETKLSPMPKRRKNPVPLANQVVIDQARRVIDEATFIGIIKTGVRREYFDLASFSRTNLLAVKDILRKEKQLLTQEFNDLHRQGALEILKKQDHKRYGLLYRAKYLQDPN